MKTNDSQTTNWWTKHSKIYDRIWDSPWTEYFGGYIVGILKENQVQKVLEVGCGTGLITKLFVENDFDVISSDNCEKMLECAKAKCEKTVDFVCKDASQFLYEDENICEAVVAMNLLHVCDDAEAVIKSIIKKIEKDNAIAILTWPTDYLTISSMFALDKKYGRSFTDSVYASMLRLYSGLSGAQKNIRRNNHKKILETINNCLLAQSLINIEKNETIEGCQHVMVLQPAARMSII